MILYGALTEASAVDAGDLRGQASIVEQQIQIGSHRRATGQFTQPLEQEWRDGLSVDIFHTSFLPGFLDGLFHALTR
jgi:hypothetical protein